jgi:hypothetical protein
VNPPLRILVSDETGWIMSRWITSKRLIATLAGACFAVVDIAGFTAMTATSASAASSTIVVAQAYDAPPVRRYRPHTRITVTPYPSYDRLHRDCRAWYEVQHRPSGDVIYPQMNCQWSVR